MKFIVAFDVETSGLTLPGQENSSEVIQIGAVAINFRTLEKAGQYSSLMNVANKELLDTDKAREALRINGKTKEEILSARSPEIVWKDFCSWMRPFGGGASRNESRCMIAGQNVLKFDLAFVEDLCKRYGPYSRGRQTLFHNKIVYDTYQLWPWWFSEKELEEYSMDTLREHFGMKQEGSHDALKDAQDSAWITASFIKYHRRIGTAKFKNAFNKENPYEQNC